MKNKRGFTIVELVIVIAVVAVLAAVMIPTFAGIVEKATVSADTRKVRDMNIILAAENSSEPAPDEVSDVIGLLRNSGIDGFLPLTEFYTFYWLKTPNVIILADEGDHPVFPEEYIEEVYADGEWFALDRAVAAPPPTRPESSDEEPNPDDPQTYTVTVKQTGISTPIDFGIPSTVPAGEEFRLELSIPDEMQDRHLIEKLTVIMDDGDTRHKFVARSELAEITGSEDSPFFMDETAVLEIPCVTGNISVSIAIRVYTVITLKGEHLKEGKSTYRVLEYDISKKLHISDFVIEELMLEEGYRITSAIGTQNGKNLGELYDERKNRIYSNKVTYHSDIAIELVVEKIVNNVELIIKNSKNNTEIARASQRLEYPTDSCSFDLNTLLGNKKVQSIRKSFDPAYIYSDEDLRPEVDHNEDTNLLTVSGIKRSFTLTCYVTLEE